MGWSNVVIIMTVMNGYSWSNKVIIMTIIILNGYGWSNVIIIMTILKFIAGYNYAVLYTCLF